VVTAAIFCNGLVFAITGMVIFTRGLSSRAPYAVLTLLMLLVPLVNEAVLIARRRPTGAGASPGLARADRAAIALNLASFAAAASSAVAQYPYASRGTLLPFAVLAVGTPVLSVAAILTRGRRSSPKAQGSTTPASGEGTGSEEA
jgi:hypothetical protein